MTTNAHRVQTGVALNPADYREAIESLPRAVVPSISGIGRGSLGALSGLRVYADDRIPQGKMMELYGGENVDQAMEWTIMEVCERNRETREASFLRGERK